MIEFPITLTSGGSVCLPGHASALALGYAKNKSVYRLAVTATGEWAGLTIRAFWHVPGGSDPASTLVVDGYVAVPASVTAQPGNGCITFEGSDGTRTVTSADLRYRVSANSGTEDGTMPEPGTPAWQELVGAVKSDAAAVQQAALQGVLENDPRPSYQHDPERVYGMEFGGLEVHFKVDGETLTVTGIDHC